MKRYVLMAVMVVAVAMGVRAQELGECGTPYLQAAMERECAQKAMEEQKARMEMGKEQDVAPAQAKKGLVLHYSFGKGGQWGPGAVVRDLSGNGHDGTVEGDGLEVVRGIGTKKKAARFDGRGDYIRVPRDASMEQQEVTMAAWVKVRKEAMWEAGATIAFKRNSSFHHNEAYNLELFPDRTARATVAGPSAAQCRIQSTVPMEDEVWHHVAMTHAPGDTRLYIDGTLAGQEKFPQVVVHNTGADLLIGGRDHAEYPMGPFGMFDLAEVKVWNKALGATDIARLHAAKMGRPGIGAAGMDWKALSEFGADRRLNARGIVPPKERMPICGGYVPVDVPPRVFPKWEPGTGKTEGKVGMVAELKTLVVQGRRDRAASPEFLAALEAWAEKWEKIGGTDVTARWSATDKLPMVSDWRGEEWPLGWNAVRRDVWRFGDGEARQVESRANTRYVLYYEPGMAWKDYEMRVKFESDKWLIPPATSAAAVYVRYKGVDDAYRVTWTGDGTLILDSCETGGKLRLLASREMPVEMVKDGLEWRVKVQGEEISVWHGDKRMLEVRDGTHREGSVGMESIHIPMVFTGVNVR